MIKTKLNKPLFHKYHGPLSQKNIHERYRYFIPYVMLTQLVSNLVPGFRFVLESINNNHKVGCIE